MDDSKHESMHRGLRQVIRFHLLGGALGLVLGLVAALVAINYGPRFLSASPVFTTLALGMVGTIALATFSGLFTYLTAAKSAGRSS